MTVDPLKLKHVYNLFHVLFVFVMLLVYKASDIVEPLYCKVFGRNISNSFDINQELLAELDASGHGVPFEKLKCWIDSTYESEFKIAESSIPNAIIETILTSFWSAHVYVCCKSFQDMSKSERVKCVRWTRTRCHKVHELVRNAEIFSRLAPKVDLFMKDVFNATDETLLLFFDAIAADFMSRNAYWAAIYTNCRLRSKLAKNGMFSASVALHAAVAWCDKESSDIYGSLFRRDYRLRICLIHPLAFFSCEKCVHPNNEVTGQTNESASALLERALHVVCDGDFRRQLALQVDRTSDSYRDNLTIDLSLNTSLGFFVSEWPVPVLERLLWMAENGRHRLPKEFWISLKEMRRHLVADLRKFNVSMLIHYSVAGIVFLNGESDSFFRLIGNEQAPIRLRCQLPKPRFEDVINAGLAKACGGDGTYVMCDLPGVSGYFKGVNVGGSILFVKCSTRLAFSAKKSQQVL